jgi:hypothetical protein
MASLYFPPSDISSTSNIANAAYDKANSANVIAVAAFNTANAAGGPAIISAYNQANAAYDKANSANVIAVAAFNAANAGGGTIISAAYDKANSANYYAYLVDANTQAAFNQANAANVIASAAFDKANAANVLAFNIGIGANAYTVTVGAASNTIASAAFDQANAANVLAFNTGAGANSYSNATFVKLSSSGQTIVGNISITGSLTVSGNTYKIDANTLVVQDPLIYLAGNNYTSDIVDIGFVANYNNGACSTVHTGLVRDYISKEYYLFHEYNQEPANNFIDTAGNNFTLSVLNSTIKTSNLILGGVNAIGWISSSFTKANNALANTNGTFAGNLTIAGAITANNGNNLTNIPILDLSQIWGSASVNYTGIKYNTTNAGSGINSLLIDLRRDNISQFSVDKGGSVSVGGGLTVYSTITWNQSGNKGILSSVTPGTIQMGATDAAAPVTQNLIAQSVVGGTTDTAGINFFIAGSKSTGTGAGGALIFQTANANSVTSSTQNALYERMRIDQLGNVSIGYTSTAYKFDVNGNANVSGSLFVLGTNVISALVSSYTQANTFTITGANTKQVIYANAGSANGSNNFVYDFTNNRVGIGTATPQYTLDVAGSLAAQTKSFLINHPTRENMKLRYGSLEGPENGVYIRGRTQNDMIELPEYWTALVDENTITVLLTPIGNSKMPSVKSIQDNVVYLTKPWFSSIDCYYHIFAERKDVPKLIVEY